MNGKTMRHITLSLLMLISLLAPSLRPAAAAGTPTFSLSSSAARIAAGEEAMIEIEVDGAVDLVAYELTLSVDPNLWTVVGASSSDLSGYEALPKQSLQADGVVTFVFAKIGQSAGENGHVRLAGITLKAKKAGNDRIRLTGVRLVDSGFAAVDYAPDSAVDVAIVNPGGGSSDDDPPGGDGDGEGDGNGEGNGEGGGNGSGDADNGAQRQVVEADSLKPDGGGRIVVEMAADKRELWIPRSAVAIDGMTKLELRAQDTVLTFDPVDLKRLVDLASGQGWQDGFISLKLERVSGSEAEEFVGLGNVGGATVKPGGPLYHVDLSIVSADGKEIRLDRFEQPVVLSLPYDAGADINVLGIYYFNESSNEWEYVGGTLERARSVIEARLDHFSLYAVLEYERTFNDMPADHWAYDAIRILTAKHVVNGVSDTSYAPGVKVTRAEFAALLSRALGLRAEQPAPFADVDGRAWYADEVAAAFEAGLVAGKSGSVFAPGAEITREEMAAMLVRAYEFGTGRSAPEGEAAIADRSSISGWAVRHVDAAVNAGLMKGTGGGKFAPLVSTSRAEAAMAVHNLLTALESFKN